VIEVKERPAEVMVVAPKVKDQLTEVVLEG